MPERWHTAEQQAQQGTVFSYSLIFTKIINNSYDVVRHHVIGIAFFSYCTAFVFCAEQIRRHDFYTRIAFLQSVSEHMVAGTEETGPDSPVLHISKMAAYRPPVLGRTVVDIVGLSCFNLPGS